MTYTIRKNPDDGKTHIFHGKTCKCSYTPPHRYRIIAKGLQQSKVTCSKCKRMIPGIVAEELKKCIEQVEESRNKKFSFKQRG